MQESVKRHIAHMCAVITHRNQNLLVSALLFLSFGNNDELTIYFLTTSAAESSQKLADRSVSQMLAALFLG